MNKLSDQKLQAAKAKALFLAALAMALLGARLGSYLYNRRRR